VCSSDLPAGLALICVDMPIGLADRGPRRCDGLARALLPRGRKSSVFPPPRRPMLAHATWAAANDWGKREEGSGLTVYAWGLMAKIRELDRALGPGDQRRVRESHPELAFSRMNGGALVQPDDVLDACACLVTARRIRRDDAIRLPLEPARDARGLAMEIWY
jgi:predicted RNase H-like nuclease